MKFTDFMLWAMAYDHRNVFAECDNVDVLPKYLQEFYKECNPIDVEVSLSGIGTVRFYSAEELDGLQKDYLLPADCFVFATCNSDPIFVRDGKVFSTVPERFVPELLAENFLQFLELIKLNSDKF